MNYLAALLDSDWPTYFETVKEADPVKLVLSKTGFKSMTPADVARQVKGFQAAKSKCPEWAANPAIAYPSQERFAQSSSEATARFKAHLLKGLSIADLCGGAGVDAYFMVKQAPQYLFNEPDFETLAIARHNLALIADGVQFATKPAEHFEPSELSAFEAIYLDPSRRSSAKGRTLTLSDFQPNLLDMAWLQQNEKTILIKFSPGQDLHQLQALFPWANQVYVVSVGNECKEILMLKKPGALGFTKAVELEWKGQCHSFTGANVRERPLLPMGEPHAGMYLLDPGAAIQKAGLASQLAFRHGLVALHSNTHAYLSAVPISSFFGRQFKIIEVIPASERALARRYKAKGVQISLRNYAYNGEQLRQKLGLKAGNEVHLFFTTGASGAVVMEVEMQS